MSVPPGAGIAAGAVMAACVLCWVGMRLPVRIAAAVTLFGFTAFGMPALAGRARAETEGPVIVNMALIAQKQELFREQRNLDRDQDGLGEYGGLIDLERTRPPLIHEALGAGQQFGYRFYIILGRTIDQSERGYFAFAVPHHYGVTGRRTVYVDETGVVRVGAAGPTPVLTRELGRSLAPAEVPLAF